MGRFLVLLRVYGVLDALPLSAIGTAVYSAARFAYLKLSGKPRERVSVEVARGLLVWYLVTLVIVVWLPDLPGLLFGRMSAGDFAAHTFFFGSYVSNGRFWELLRGDIYVLRDHELSANIALFVPYGLLLPVAFRKLRWWAADLIALGTTLCVELLQPFVGRVCDVDDIIANTLGAVLGCAATKLVLTLCRRRS